ncbi:hypothetical protein ACQP1U_05665 [Actinomycetota bacterium]
MTVEVNYAGLDTLVALAARQGASLSRIGTFVSNSCSPAPFAGGILSLFQGQYADAHSTMVAALSESTAAAQRASTVIAANRRTYREQDLAASTRMSGLEERVGQAPVPERGTVPDSTVFPLSGAQKMAGAAAGAVGGQAYDYGYAGQWDYAAAADRGQEVL